MEDFSDWYSDNVSGPWSKPNLENKILEHIKKNYFINDLIS